MPGKIYTKLVVDHGDELLTKYKKGKLKSEKRVVKTNARKVLLWTGSCMRLPKKSALAKHTRKAGVKRAVVICPATSDVLYTVTLDREGDSMREIAHKAYRSR